jgi:hypothetical protein
MAFATSNLVARNLGSIRMLTGNWSANAGDTPGTIAIGAGNIISASFDPRLSSGPSEICPIATSVSNGQTTVTVYHKQTVANGVFKIEY